MTRSKLRKGIGIGTNGEDLISNLPECVLSRILSSLPLKDAVRTSILSKDWEKKWTSIYNVEIDDRLLFPGAANNVDFVKFMDWILPNIQQVRSFRLLIHREYDARHIRRWSVIFRRNVERVTICHFNASFDPHNIVLSRSVVNCTSLRELKICMPCTLKVSGKICFPKLTEVFLNRVTILNENSSIDTLTCTFPVLEKLQLFRCKWLNVWAVEIHAPALSFFQSAPTYDGVDNYIIKFFGAKLARYQTCDTPENVRLIGSTAFHVFITDNNDDDVLKLGIQVRKLLNEFACLEELTVSCYVTKAIVQAKAILPLPEFDQLRRLFLSNSGWHRDHVFRTKGVIEVLHLAPYLEFLAIKSGSLDEYDYEGMESVPSCIISHLEEVKLQSFCGTSAEIGFVKFLLKFGTQLKMFSVSVLEGCDVDLVRQQVLGLRTASTCLTMAVT